MLLIVYEIAVPMLFILGVAPLFHWGRVAKLVWTVSLCAISIGTVLIIIFLERKEQILVIMCPAIQLTWYHLLRRYVYGSWSAKPKFMIGDPREKVGSVRDRVFSVVFVFSALLIPVII